MPRKGGHPETPKAGPKLANKYSGLVIIVAENGFMLKKADKRLIESMNGSGTQTWRNSEFYKYIFQIIILSFTPYFFQTQCQNLCYQCEFQ